MYRTVIEENPKNIAIIDVFSILIKDRIIFIDGIITDELANAVIAQMLYLNSQDSSKQINIYINSQGGSVYAGLAIWDVSKVIKAPIRTVGIGMAASMGAVLMLMGKERVGLPHTRFMLHQVSGGAFDKLSDMLIHLEEIKGAQQDVYNIIKEYTNIQDPETSLKDDKWMKSKEALECGLLTEIL